jgi:DNA adenine methylase
MRRLRSPIQYIGGKGNLVSKLLKLIPPHRLYVEVFGGGASLLFAKEPSPVEVYNDIDSLLVNLFRVLRDEEKFEKFYRKVFFTPYSREEFYRCRDTLNEEDDEIEKAYKFFVIARMSFSGKIKSNSWSYALTSSYRGMAGKCSSWISTIELLPEIHARLMRVQIENDDFRKIIERYDTPNTLFYLDPPYVLETRKQKLYKYEMFIEDHKDLVNLLINIKGKAILSGYYHPVYSPLEEVGWKRIDIETACHAAGRTRASKILGKGSATQKVPRVESIWLSPNIAYPLLSL